MNLCKIIVGAQPRACAMRLPLMLDQARGRNNICVGLWIGWAGRITAMLGIVAARILRPQSMHHKPQVTSALRAVTVGRAELRRPRKGQQVKIELPRCRLLLRTSAARPAPVRPLIVPGVIRAVSRLIRRGTWTRLCIAMRSHSWWGRVIATYRRKQKQ
jgi:hypothetical protein